MKKLAVRLLMTSMLTTSMLVLPIVTQVSAATTNGKHTKKVTMHQRPKAADPSANPFASKYEDDFDRRNAGGAGGY